MQAVKCEGDRLARASGPWLPQDLRDAIGRIAQQRRAGVLETILRLLREAVGRCEDARRHGRQGGHIRASRLTPEQRQAIARLGGLARKRAGTGL